jgi:hypothetical protein
MLNFVRFGKNCSCHLQGEYVLVGNFWKPYIGQEVGGEWDLMNDWRSGRVDCYPVGDKHKVEEKK